MVFLFCCYFALSQVTMLEKIRGGVVHAGAVLLWALARPTRKRSLERIRDGAQHITSVQGGECLRSISSHLLLRV